MSATPGNEGADHRRRWVIIAIVLGIIAIVAAVAAVWLFFFGSEAPPAPTLDDALQSLQSAVPAE